MTPGHVRDHLQCSENTPEQHKDAQGHLKDTPDGYKNLAETHRWGLQIVIFLTDVSLSIRDFYDSLKRVLVGASDHWIPGSQWV